MTRSEIKVFTEEGRERERGGGKEIEKVKRKKEVLKENSNRKHDDKSKKKKTSLIKNVSNAVLSKCRQRTCALL